MRGDRKPFAGLRRQSVLIDHSQGIPVSRLVGRSGTGRDDVERVVDHV